MIKYHAKVPGTIKVQDRFPSHPSLRVHFGKSVGVSDTIGHETVREYHRTALDKV